MRRTIQISDKYKDMIEKYELDLGKEEFYMLITKLLKVNKDLEDKHINIFLLYELIDKYNLDFFSLINIISNHSLNIQNVNIIEKPKEEEKIEDIKDSPLIDLNKTIKPKIENVTNIVKTEDKKEKKEIKEIKTNKIIEEIPKTEIKTETETENRTENEDTFYNPILSLGIDLS